MCVAVPGRIVAVDDGGPVGGQIGTVDLQGTRVEASLVLTPDARVGDWVLVHAGFAIQLLEESDALETWEYLRAFRTSETSTLQGPGEP